MEHMYQPVLSYYNLFSFISIIVISGSDMIKLTCFKKFFKLKNSRKNVENILQQINEVFQKSYKYKTIFVKKYKFFYHRI